MLVVTQLVSLQQHAATEHNQFGEPLVMYVYSLFCSFYRYVLSQYYPSLPLPKSRSCARMISVQVSEYC